MKLVPLDQITLANWLQLVDTSFLVSTDPAPPAELRLVKLNRAAHLASESSKTAAPKIESFSLIFHGPGNRPLSQKTYRFEHPQLGCFDLFIVPTGLRPEAWEYEAIFNRLAKPS
jgi:hypothetical protein